MTDPHCDELFEAASHWIVKLRSEDASDADRLAFSRWLNAGQDHVSAFDEALALWEAMGTAGAKINAAGSATIAAKPEKYFPAMGMAIAASLACFAVMIFVLALSPTPAAQSLTYATDIGEQSTIVLPDQSEVTLNTNTSIVVEYSQRQRVIRLLQGEAYFDVATDKSRPFTVELKRGSVTAVGTAFNIFAAGKTDQVTVTEGVVRVKQVQDEATPYPESKFLRANEALSLTSSGISAVNRAASTLPWLDQTLSFDSTPLSVAVNELNRYLPSPVIASDPELAKLRVSGTFSTAAPHETLSAILEGFDLTLQSDGQLHLSSTKIDH